MLYLLALIGVLVIAAVLWMTFRPRSRPAGPTRGLGPDDDPEFLRRLNERRDDE